MIIIIARFMDLSAASGGYEFCPDPYRAFGIPDSLAAATISLNSSCEMRQEMNFQRFSFFGRAGRPTGFGAVMSNVLVLNGKQYKIHRRRNYQNKNQNGYYFIPLHGFLVFFGGGGVLSNAFKTSLNPTPLRLRGRAGRPTRFGSLIFSVLI